MKVKAMILAAGLGSRLRPLTDRLPKAMLEFQGKTMLEHVIDQLKAYGIRDLVINLHHHSDILQSFIEEQNGFGMNITFSDERNLLMDTGGAIVRAGQYLKDQGPFIVHNIDIKSNINFDLLYQSHLSSGALASLAVKNRKTSRNLLINKQGLLCGWRNNITGEEIISRNESNLMPVAFSGIQVLDPEIFDLLDNSEPFSIIPAFLELAKQRPIATYMHDSDTWVDMAHPANFSGLS